MSRCTNDYVKDIRARYECKEKEESGDDEDEEGSNDTARLSFSKD